MKNNIKKPEILYYNLFLDKERTEILQLLSEGIYCLMTNIEGLLDDAILLAEYGRHERSYFLAVTAREEIAKIYILLDACRLDF